MKVALVYDRINKWGGAERLLLSLHRIFPTAPVYTSVYERRTALWANQLKIYPSSLNRVVWFRRHHQQIPFLMPFAFESLDLSAFEVVISVTSAEAKGIITLPRTMHLCYCLTPTRYLYSHRLAYTQHLPIKKISHRILTGLQKWDQVACWRPDFYLSISHTVKQRIKRYYGQEADVIYPPLTLPKKSDQPSNFPRQSFFLIVSRLEPYKKIDVAIQAFNKLAKPLIIVGCGSQEKRLKKIARPNIRFIPELTDSQLFDYYKSCCAFIMPQEEDFGLTALEAQACYKPVLAFNKGGAQETVIKGKTGLFFDRQTIDDMIDGIYRIEHFRINKTYFDQNISRFSFNSFSNQIMQYLEKKWQSYNKPR